MQLTFIKCIMQSFCVNRVVRLFIRQKRYIINCIIFSHVRFFDVNPFQRIPRHFAVNEFHFFFLFNDVSARFKRWIIKCYKAKQWGKLSQNHLWIATFSCYQLYTISSKNQMDSYLLLLFITIFQFNNW